MSIYQKISGILGKHISSSTLLKVGFNLSPMYRRSTARIIHVSKDLMNIAIKLPLSWKNKNYVNSIFGGSMFAAVDPIPMVQLINIIGSDYVVWDKSAEIFFKRPAKENLYADFVYTLPEIEEIKNRVMNEKEIEIIKTTQLTNKDKSIVFCEVQKKIYIAGKEHYKNKLAARKERKKE
jgi:acyl-CoA hydrolase